MPPTRRALMRTFAAAPMFGLVQVGDAVADIDYGGQALRDITSIEFSDGSVQDTAYTGSDSTDNSTSIDVAEPTVIAMGFATGDYIRYYPLSDYATGGEAVQAALDDLPSKGGIVELPAADIDVHATIWMPGGKNTTVQLLGSGTGWGGSQYDPNRAGTRLNSKITDGSPVVDANGPAKPNRGNLVANLVVSAEPEHRDGTGIKMHLVSETGGIYNVYVVGTGGPGVDLVNCYNNHFQQVRVHNAWSPRGGFYAENCNGSAFDTCHVTHANPTVEPPGPGFKFVSATGVHLDACTASRATIGFDISGRAVVLTSPYGERNSEHVVRFSGAKCFALIGGQLNGTDQGAANVLVDGVSDVLLSHYNSNYKRNYNPGNAYHIAGVNGASNVRITGVGTRLGDGRIDPHSDWAGKGDVIDQDRGQYVLDLDTQYFQGLRSAVPSVEAANAIYLDDGSNTGDGLPGWRLSSDHGRSWNDI